MITLPANLDLIGYAFNSDKTQSLISGWQQLQYIDDEEISKAIREHRLSLIEREKGLYLFFTDEDSYRRRYGLSVVIGTLVISRVVLLISSGQEFSSYSGDLPCGLSHDAKLDDISNLIGQPSKYWKIGDECLKARWETQARVMDISFCQQSGRIKLISVTPSYDPEWLSEKNKVNISPEKFHMMFGMTAGNFMRQSSLHQFDFGSQMDSIPYYKEADFSSDHGVEFFFKQGSEFSEYFEQVAQPRALYFSGVRYRSDLDFSSCGFEGALPFGIEFDDPWEVVAEKVGSPASKEFRDNLDGFQLWEFENYDLHVLSSFLEDRIYRITFDAKMCG
jgi:hypothetical protein